MILAQREYKVLTYRSLQPHKDFVDRGVSQLPKYFYREHCLMIWDAIHRLVQGCGEAHRNLNKVKEDLYRLEK